MVRGAICRMSRTTLGPGESRALVALCHFEQALVDHFVDGLVLTDRGVLVTGFAVLNAVHEVPRL